MEETGNLPTLEEIKLQNRSNANHYLKSMKPVAMDVGLEFHEKLIHKVDHSLKSTKNRLQRTELLLNLEPPSDEASNHEEWEETIKDLLSSNHRLEFPKFSKIQKQHEIRQLLQRQTKSREKARSREDYNRRAAMILAKETQNLQKKILAGKGQFGGAVKGVEIKTIHNYRGCNTFDRDTRTLVRKEGQRFPESHENSLPPWFGPQYYEVTFDPSVKKDSSYQVAFKSPERDATSSGVLYRENIRRRREELANANESRGYDRVREYFRSPESRDGKSHFDADETSNLSDDVDPDDGESLSSYPSRSLGSTSKDNMETSSIASSNTNSMDFSEESLGRILERYDATMLKSQRRQSPLTPSNQNRISMTPLPDKRVLSREKKRRRLRRQPSRRDSATSTVLNPILTHHSFALKIIESDDPSKQRGWKPKDYTLNALVNQRPIEFSTYFLEDTFAETKDPNVSATDSTPNNSKPSTANPSTVLQTLPNPSTSSNSATTRGNIKYSSEIFRRQPGAVYKSSEQLMREAEIYMEKRKKNNASTSLPSKQRGGGGANSSAQPNQSMSASTIVPPAHDLLDTASQGSGKSTHPPHSDLVPALLETSSLATSIGESHTSSNSPAPPGHAIAEFSRNVSPRDIQPSRSLTPLKENTRAHLTEDGIPDNTVLNTTTSLAILKMSSKQLLRSSFSSSILKPSPTQSQQPASPGSPTQFGDMLKQWYKENHIIKYKPTAGPTMRQKFLQSQLGTTDQPSTHHQPEQSIPHYMQDPRRRSVISPRKRPSLDLSLRGLLLEENPYLSKEQKDRLITENQDKELHEIQV